MKITLNPNAHLPVEWQGSGSYSFASFSCIIATMIAAGELRVDPDEIVEGVTIETNGLSFKIGRK